MAPVKFSTIKDLEKHLKPNLVNGCHIWTGRYVTKDGNTEIPWQGKNRLVHRIMYEAKNGPIPNGAYVIRTCKNHQCCNPLHMGLKNVRNTPKTEPEPEPVTNTIVDSLTAAAAITKEEVKTITFDVAGIKVTISR